MNYQTQNVHLLLVEDHEATAFMLFTALILKGYAVQLASSVQEAHEYLKEEPVDLVITDWYLPDGTGAEVCAFTRLSRRGMPVVVASAVADCEETPIMDCQPDALLYKPFDLNKLYQSLGELLGHQLLTS